jgi:hypothetical protein
VTAVLIIGNDLSPFEIAAGVPFGAATYPTAPPRRGVMPV